MKLPRSLVLILLFAALPATLCAAWITDIVVMSSKGAGAVNFSHYTHLEAVGNNCPSCHNGIFHIRPEKNPVATMKDMAEGKSCGACHNGQKAFSVKEGCSSCHPTRDIVFKNADAGDITFSHEAHTGMFGCSECHPDLFLPGPGNQRRTMQEMEQGDSCGACHDGNAAFSVKEDCENCHQM
ncbi:c-type cytochrome [Desulfuromonas versatilis]|uniref:C-type cytochrome n=1 Tax=Desulfuromonas versatilis TaxID=2802975 RepID=A0ABM8HSG6_9BACT|nr:cytochrome c3 family protein [Desulfuromonas versatilis]BCR03909.1 c-type cytochrome [Desulfuromonas versatilis]